MTRAEKWILFISNFLTIVTGLVYAWMVYCLKPVNEWDVFNHPWQKQTQALHILVVPLLIFAMGLIWKKHIQERMFKKGQPRKFTGYVLLLVLLPMVLSGYLLQVATEENFRQFFSYLHLWTSLIWTLFFFIHLFKFRRT